MKDFDKWNNTKKLLEKLDDSGGIFPIEGEAWVVYMGTNIGYEQDSNSLDFTRPALVIKKFNNKMMWILPLSNKQKDLDFYFNFIDPRYKNISAILAQLKLMSVKRFKRKMYKIPDIVLIEIKNKLVSLLQIENPR